MRHRHFLKSTRDMQNPYMLPDSVADQGCFEGGRAHTRDITGNFVQQAMGWGGGGGRQVPPHPLITFSGNLKDPKVSIVYLLCYSYKQGIADLVS